jgi:hypothetical protein
MTTLYAYWDKRHDMVVHATIGSTLETVMSKLVGLVGKELADSLVCEGDLFITEIKVERVV